MLYLVHDELCFQLRFHNFVNGKHLLLISKNVDSLCARACVRA